MQKEKVYSQYMYSFPHKKSYTNISGEIIENVFMKTTGEIGIYIHIPFCSSKCGYCNLFSIVKRDEDYINKYVSQILREIDYIKGKMDLNSLKVRSLIIGGGTPFILSIQQMESLFSKVEDIFSVNLREIDFQMETSPNETTSEKLVYLKGKGLKRLSIGVQSFIDDELKDIYRQHSLKNTTLALANIKKVNFSGKNLDIIYGLPNQTKGSLIASLKKAVSYDFEEIFLYPLYIRENTILGKQNLKIDETHQFKLYEEGRDFLIKEGYTQISMRRFVKNPDRGGKSCGFEKSIALGCGGRSYLDNVHFCEEYSSDTRECLNIIESYLNKTEFFQEVKGFILEKKHLKIRFLIKNLGHISGVDKKEYHSLFESDLLKDFPEIGTFIDKNYVSEENGILKLTKRGIGLSDYILYAFIPEDMRDSFHE